jgi:stage V sporulation protein B
MPLIRILALTLPFVSLSVAFNGYFVGVRRVRANALVQIFSQLMRILLSSALVSAYGGEEPIASLRLICLAILITELTSFALIVIQYLIDRVLHKSPLKERGRISEISSVALPLALSQYVRSALVSIEHMLIPKRLEKGGLTSSEALSSYGILHGMALPAVLLPMSPLSSFSGLLVPEFARDQAMGNYSRMSRLTTRAMELTLTYASVVAAVVFYFSDELGTIIYSSAEAGSYLRILAPVIPIMYLDHVSDQILKGIGEQVYSMWVNIADSFLSIILVFFLLPPMGIRGYALVIIIMEAFNFIMSFARLRSRIKVRIPILKGLLFPLALAGLCCRVSSTIFLSSERVALICKILFTICLFVFLDRICNIILCNINKRKKYP